jgi:hypothetical protein
MAANIIGRAGLGVMEYNINSPCMIFYPKPIAYVLAFTVNRYRFLLFNIIDSQWYQLLGEVVRPIIVEQLDITVPRP